MRRVFISWSGPRSKAIATVLRGWLGDVFETIETFMSQADIEAGRSWSEEIAQQLDECAMGVLCVTRENLKEPWLLFEAGALAKRVDGNRAKVIPYLYGLTPVDLGSSPLARFQSKRADPAASDETFAVVESINRECSKPRDAERLRRAFDLWWPRLKQELLSDKIAKDQPAAPPPPPDGELLVQLIGLVQGLSSKVDSVGRTVNSSEQARSAVHAAWDERVMRALAGVPAPDSVIATTDRPVFAVEVMGATGPTGPGSRGPAGTRR